MWCFVTLLRSIQHLVLLLYVFDRCTYICAHSTALFHSVPPIIIELVFCLNIFFSFFFIFWSVCFRYTKNAPLWLFRKPDPAWFPNHWYGSPAEGGWKDQNRYHAVCCRWKSRPRDLLVQGHASCGYQQQQRPHQTASLRYSWILVCVVELMFFLLIEFNLNDTRGYFVSQTRHV